MKTVKSFLNQNLLSDQHYHAETEIRSISQAMTRALEKKSGSVPMLPTYLSVCGLIEEGTPVIVLDAGGTNLRVALVTIRNRCVVEEHYAKHPMPGTLGTVTKEEFFDSVAEKISPLCKKSNVISFCFSYITEPLADHDAVVASLCKEVHIEGLAGAHVCAELSKALVRQGVSRKLEFYLLNDAVASVLGGISELDPGVEYDAVMGMIWGTGFNICYTENTDRIQTSFPYHFENMMINTEVGEYDGFEQGAIDVALDRLSMQPGEQKAEKMIGGAYLGDLILRTLWGCAEENLLSEAFLKLGKIELRDVDALLSGAKPQSLPECTVRELEIVRDVSAAVYRRAAKLVACMLVAVAQRVKGDHAQARIAVIADGSTLLKSEFLMDALREFCTEICEPRNIQIDLIPTSSAIIKGTAYAALLKTNKGYFPE